MVLEFSNNTQGHTHVHRHALGLLALDPCYAGVSVSTSCIYFCPFLGGWRADGRSVGQTDGGLMDREWMAARRTDTEADLGHVKGKVKSSTGITTEMMRPPF